MKTKKEKRAAITHERNLPFSINKNKHTHKMHNDHATLPSTHAMICLSSLHSPTTTQKFKIDSLCSNIQKFQFDYEKYCVVSIRKNRKCPFSLIRMQNSIETNSMQITFGKFHMNNHFARWTLLSEQEEKNINKNKLEFNNVSSEWSVRVVITVSCICGAGFAYFCGP